MLTLQEIYTKGLFHIRAQGGPSTNKFGNGCLYRNQDGLSCIIGCMIPDDMYLEGFDSATDSAVGSLIQKSEKFRKALGFSGIDVDDADMSSFLVGLQRCHDDMTSFINSYTRMSVFEEKMIKLAEKYNLEYTEPNNIS